MVAHQVSEWRREILQTLAECADDSYRIEDLVSTQGQVLGVRVPVIRQQVKEFQKCSPDVSLDDAVALLDLGCAHGIREEALFATFLLASFQRQLTGDLWKKFDTWVGTLDNWETCDQLANVAGGVVAAHLELVDDLVAWANSDNKWRRRIAVATTTDLNHKGRAHPEETFRILDPVLDDPESMIHKATGWALREVSKHAPEATAEFLTARLGRCHPRILREGTRKLPPELRDPLLSA